jgi:endonuclease G, mitochondrial
MKKLYWITILLFIFSCEEESFDVIDVSTFQPVSTGELVQHTYLNLAYSEEHEQALWVFYSITPKQFEGSPVWPKNYRIDSLVTTGSATNSDYDEPVYDRGHLCPTGSMQQNYTAWSETFFLSNISPQLPDFNGGVWVRLENQVRKWVEKYKKLWVVTGPIFKDNLDTIGVYHRVTVPGYFYKVIFNGKDQMIGFIVPHKASDAKPISFAVSVDNVEAQTKIDFFAGLPDDIENSLEAKYDLSYWK